MQRDWPAAINRVDPKNTVLRWEAVITLLNNVVLLVIKDKQQAVDAVGTPSSLRRSTWSSLSGSRLLCTTNYSFSLVESWSRA